MWVAAPFWCSAGQTRKAWPKSAHRQDGHGLTMVEADERRHGETGAAARSLIQGGSADR